MGNLTVGSKVICVDDYIQPHMREEIAKDFINIKNEKTENLSYQIFDISGKLILSGKSKSNEKIDIQTLEKGNYFLQIQNENGQKEILKLIKF